MKKKRGLFIILAGVVLLCVLIACYIALVKVNSSEEETAEEETAQEEVAAIASDDISTLTFEAGDQTLTFQKGEDSWTLEGQKDFPVDASKVDNVASSLASIKADRTLTDVDDPGEYGLEDPVNVIEVVKTDGTTEKITVGDKNSSTGNTYICLNDDTSTVYTTGSDLGNTFSGGLYNYAESESYPTITSSTISKIAVKKDSNSYTLTNNGKSSTGWYVEGSDKNKQEADSTQAGTLQSTVAGITFAGYYDYNCTDWASYGLEKPKMTLTVDYTEEVEQDTTDSSENDSEANTDDTDDSGETTTQTVDRELVLYVGSVNETDGNYYVRLGDSGELHGISQESLETLLNGKAFDYWKTSIDSMTISDLDHLDVTYEGTTYTLKRVVTEEKVEKDESEDTDDDADADSEDADEEETKTVTTYYVNDQEADSDNFTAFYRAAAAMVCQSRLEENTTKGDAELTLSYHGTDGSEITISYTPRDSSFYVMEDQDGNCGLVNKMNVKDLIDSFLTLTEDEK